VSSEARGGGEEQGGTHRLRWSSRISAEQHSAVELSSCQEAGGVEGGGPL
jgi:hypothetical protein